jgi:hypothetical protein
MSSKVSGNVSGYAGVKPFHPRVKPKGEDASARELKLIGTSASAMERSSLTQSIEGKITPKSFVNLKRFRNLLRHSI